MNPFGITVPDTRVRHFLGDGHRLGDGSGVELGLGIGVRIEYIIGQCLLVRVELGIG